MKLSYLTTLQSVIHTGSFAAAASEGNLTPSAVSQRMQQLELYFGRPLFDRSLREARPTPLAHEVVATVIDALDGLEMLRDQRSMAVSGRVRLGALHSAQLSTIPACLSRLRQRHPTLEVDVKAESSQWLLSALRADKIDVAVVVRPQTEPRGCDWINLRRESFVLVVPASTTDVPLRRIAQAMPWIRYNGTSTSGQVAARFVRAQIPGIKASIDVQTASVIVAMVATGLGFSVMPQVPAALLRIYGARQITLDRQLPQRQIALAIRSADRDNRRTEALTACLQEGYEQDARRAE